MLKCATGSLIASLFVFASLCFTLPSKPKQIRIHKSQISNAGICSSYALPGGRQLDSQGFKQGDEKKSAQCDMFCVLLCCKYWAHRLFLVCFLFIQQLHSSVRTGNLETCLRLLSLGAQANFFHPVRFPLYIQSPIFIFAFSLALLWIVGLTFFFTSRKKETLPCI